MTTHTEQISGSAREIVEHMRELEKQGWEVMLLAPLGTAIRNNLVPGWHSPQSAEVETQSFLVVWDTLEPPSPSISDVFSKRELEVIGRAVQLYNNMTASPDPLYCQSILATLEDMGIELIGEN